MINLDRAAMFEEVATLLEDIDSLFEEQGLDISDFDPDDGMLDIRHGGLGKIYLHVHRLKEAIE